MPRISEDTLESGTGWQKVAGYVFDGLRDSPVEDQVARLQTWANLHDAEITVWFYEIGTSATEPFVLRPAGRQVTAGLVEGTFDAVVVADAHAVASSEDHFAAFLRSVTSVGAAALIIQELPTDWLQAFLGPNGPASPRTPADAQLN